MTRLYLRGIGVGSIALLSVSGCGSVCGDDGGAGNQEGNPACVPAADGDASAESGGSETEGATSDRPTTSADTSAADADADATAAETTEPSTGDTTDPTTQGGGLHCKDGDGDGYGDPTMCESMPFPGSVPNDQDCNDSNEFAFPGSAEAESDTECMQDEDGDGWGDVDPDPGVVPGTDCDDANEFTFPGAAPNDDPTACMKDEDGDDFGDDFGGDPPPPDVVPGSDCNDQSAFTFPGAAEIEGPDACMADQDDDGYGSDTPPPGADVGTDCADDDVDVHVSCQPCDPDMDGCVDDILLVCSDGGNVVSQIHCTDGCDDVGLKCWDKLEVDAGPTVCIDNGGATQLQATATGGDGMYTYDWTPTDSLDDPAIADPTATPVGPTTYTVNVSDGEGGMASDDVTVYINNLSLNLDPNVCTTHDFKGPGELDPDTNWSWNPNTKELCQTINGKAAALFCGWDLDNATIKGTFSVKTIVDDDWTGFIWGLQDTDHFYLFTWKQVAQDIANCGGNLPTGMQVKVIDVADPMNNPLSCADRHQNGDTVNSKLLVPTDQFYAQGWLDNVDYVFELTHKDTGEITIVVRNKLTDLIVAQTTFMDTTYPSGKFGMYTKSQISACFSDYRTFCIE